MVISKLFCTFAVSKRPKSRSFQFVALFVVVGKQRLNCGVEMQIHKNIIQSYLYSLTGLYLSGAGSAVFSQQFS